VASCTVQAQAQTGGAPAARPTPAVFGSQPGAV